MHKIEFGFTCGFVGFVFGIIWTMMSPDVETEGGALFMEGVCYISITPDLTPEYEQVEWCNTRKGVKEVVYVR